jgi:transposase InsO family protein
VIGREGPWRSVAAVALATREGVGGFNNRRLLEPLGNMPPAAVEARYQAQAARPAIAA